jgi:hypothetical protein
MISSHENLELSSVLGIDFRICENEEERLSSVDAWNPVGPYGPIKLDDGYTILENVTH